MTTATTILTVALVILCVSIYFNIKHGLILLKVQDSIERSLDILDERYRKIDESSAQNIQTGHIEKFNSRKKIYQKT